MQTLPLSVNEAQFIIDLTQNSGSDSCNISKSDIEKCNESVVSINTNASENECNTKKNHSVMKKNPIMKCDFQLNLAPHIYHSDEELEPAGDDGQTPNQELMQQQEKRLGDDAKRAVASQSPLFSVIDLTQTGLNAHRKDMQRQGVNSTRDNTNTDIERDRFTRKAHSISSPLHTRMSHIIELTSEYKDISNRDLEDTVITTPSMMSTITPLRIATQDMGLVLSLATAYRNPTYTSPMATNASDCSMSMDMYDEIERIQADTMDMYVGGFDFDPPDYGAEEMACKCVQVDIAAQIDPGENCLPLHDLPPQPKRLSHAEGIADVASNPVCSKKRKWQHSIESVPGNDEDCSSGELDRLEIGRVNTRVRDGIEERMSGSPCHNAERNSRPVPSPIGGIIPDGMSEPANADANPSTADNTNKTSGSKGSFTALKYARITFTPQHPFANPRTGEDNGFVDPEANAVYQDVNDYELTVLIDQRESDRFLILNALQSMNIPCSIVPLSLGDFVFGLRRTQSRKDEGVEGGRSGETTSRGENQQISLVTRQGIKSKLHKKRENKASKTDVAPIYVSNCILERKTMSDLLSSIIDGRYLEQKLRMKDIGNEQNRCKDHDYLSYIKLKYYVVEGTSAAYNPTLFKNKRTNARQTGRTWPGKKTFQGVGGVGSQGLKNALINTELQYGLKILRTRNIDHTISMLVHIYNYLKYAIFKNRSDCNPIEAIAYISLDDFQLLTNKSKNLNDNATMFQQQLRQMPGCSVDVINSITKHYHTLGGLMDHFRRDSDRTLSHIANLTKEKSVNKQCIGTHLTTFLKQLLVEEW